MKTLNMKKRNILKSKIKDFIFNSTRVKADIFWVKEKNEVYWETQTKYKKNTKNFLIFKFKRFYFLNIYM